MNKIVLVLILPLIGLFSCKRDYTEAGYVGTAYISASENFAFTAPYALSEATSVNFPLGLNQVFSATFNETVSWEINIKGIKSSATYTIKGTSNSIGASNATWDGRHDGIYFFESQDSVVATLKVIGYEDLLVQTFKIDVNGQRNYKSGNPNMVYINRTDFETTTTGASNINFFPTQFTISPASVFTGSVLQDNTVKAPEGFRFARVAGKSAEANGFFVGGIQHRKGSPLANPHFYITWTDPDQIYVNLYVRGSDYLLPNSKPVAVLNFEFHEDDRDDRTCDGVNNTPNERHCPSDEDSWVLKIPINHVGWKLFSSKYSNLTPAEDAANGGSGNRILQPDKIFRVQMGLVSNPPFNYVEADFDFACFTLGAPFDPKTF